MKTKNNIMNTKLIKLILALGTLALCQFAFASGDHHEHDEVEAGPNGGRVIEHGKIKCEFLFTENRLIEIRFLDDAGNVLAPEEQHVSIIGGDRSAPTTLSFSVDGEKLVSQQPFPEGNSLPLILEIKENSDSSVIRERFRLSLGSCSSCPYEEYACVCGH